ncbi:MAG: succinate dehydrogenase assembly factor 2 [Burkholderiaceae bacterium]
MPCSEYVDAATSSKLRWRCRRGMLENDLLIARFFKNYGSCLTQQHVTGMNTLMELADNDLLDLLLGRKQLDAGMDDIAVALVLNLLRQPVQHH